MTKLIEAFRNVQIRISKATYISAYTKLSLDQSVEIIIDSLKKDLDDPSRELNTGMASCIDAGMASKPDVYELILDMLFEELNINTIDELPVLTTQIQQGVITPCPN